MPSARSRHAIAAIGKVENVGEVRSKIRRARIFDLHFEGAVSKKENPRDRLDRAGSVLRTGAGSSLPSLAGEPFPWFVTTPDSRSRGKTSLTPVRGRGEVAPKVVSHPQVPVPSSAVGRKPFGVHVIQRELVRMAASAALGGAAVATTPSSSVSTPFPPSSRSTGPISLPVPSSQGSYRHECRRVERVSRISRARS